MNLKYLEYALHVSRPSGKNGTVKSLILLERWLLEWVDIDNGSNNEGMPQA